MRLLFSQSSTTPLKQHRHPENLHLGEGISDLYLAVRIGSSKKPWVLKNLSALWSANVRRALYSPTTAGSFIVCNINNSLVTSTIFRYKPFFLLTGPHIIKKKNFFTIISTLFSRETTDQATLVDTHLK